MTIKDLEILDLNRKNSLQPQILSQSTTEKNHLNIVYLMVWTTVCGGSKIILEYANRLQARRTYCNYCNI